jgi:multidrug transporter EmrE-like cation transporter
MWIYWLALSISYIVTAFGQVIYKLYAHTRSLWHLAASIAFFVIAPFTSYIALQRLSAGTVFIGAAFSQVLILVMSRTMLKEEITMDHLISMSLILLGLLMFALGGW